MSRFNTNTLSQLLWNLDSRGTVCVMNWTVADSIQAASRYIGKNEGNAFEAVNVLYVVFALELDLGRAVE